MAQMLGLAADPVADGDVDIRRPSKRRGRGMSAVWATTNDYFRAGTGRIVSQWPFGATVYILATKLLRRIAVRIS